MVSMWWFVGAMLLGIAEVFTLDMTLLMFAGGAIAAGGVTLLGLPVWASILTFCVVSTLLLFALRPYLLRALKARSEVIETNTAKLVGREARVVSEVTETGGRIKLAGEVWSAKTESDTSIADGDEVEVIRIQGATAIVAKKGK